MSSLQEIKSRMNSIRDTQKITNAMYLISSAKLNRARSEWGKTRPYFDALRTEIERLFRTDRHLSSRGILKADEPEPEGTWGCLVITADRGLAGAYNMNVLKEAQKLLEAHPDTRVFALGSYGLHYFQKHGILVEPAAVSLASNPRLQDARDLAMQFVEPFQSGELTQLYMVYSDMKNGMVQEPVTARLLPFRQEEFLGGAETESTEYECVPGAEAVLNGIFPSYVVGYLYSALVDSYCCEQSARMTAMKSANDNADSILHDLSIQYNRVRQAGITQEITEVSSGARAQQRKREQEGTV